MLNKISASIITLNEEKNLKDCLESLKDLVDEIVLVDSGSKDRTLEIAKDYKCKIFTRRFDNFANQRNFALSKISSSWVLSVDADERITKSLAEEIKEVVNKDKYTGFLIPRRNYILGAEIKHSWWSPDKHIWLWKKGFGTWVNEVHEEVKIQGEVGELKNPKIHFQDSSISEFIETNNNYSTLAAHQLFKSGRKFSIFNLLTDPILEFFIRFIYKLGFLDGWRGLILAILMAYYKFLVWIKLYKFNNQTSS